MQKSYNPFKMWGSWVGAAIGFSFIVWDLEFFNPTGPNTVYFHQVSSWLRGFTSPNYTGIYHLFSDLLIPLFVPLIVGFLAGWAIHSMVRKLTNRSQENTPNKI